MKKIFLALSLIAVSTSGAFADFVLEPATVGYSNFNFHDFTNKRSATANVLTVSLPGIGIQKHEENGFYFIWNNQFSLIGKQTVLQFFNDPALDSFLSKNATAKDYISDDVKEELDKLKSAKKLILIGYKTDFIFGGTIVPAENLCIALGAGLSVGYQSLNAFVGLPLDISVKYYFTKKVGIVLGVNDTFGIGMSFVDKIMSKVSSSISSKVLASIPDSFKSYAQKYRNIKEGKIKYNLMHQFNVRLGMTFRF